MKEIINTLNAPKAIGPYSQAVKADKFLFISGQLPMDPVTMQIAGGDVKDQTRQALENLEAILHEAGASFDNVVKTTVFIKNMDDFSKINDVYATYFTKNPPARACVEVARLPKDVEVEIEALAIVSK